MKIKCNESPDDDASVVSLGRSRISTSNNVPRAMRMRIPKRHPKHDDAFVNKPDLTQILRFSPPVPLVAPPNNPNTAGPSAPQVASPQLPTPILPKTQCKDKRQITVSDTFDSDTSSVRRSKRMLKKQKKSTTSIVENIQCTEGYSADIPVSETTFNGVVSLRNPNERWTIDPNPNLPREMTVLEAEKHTESDSD